MLVLSRRERERIKLGDSIVVTIVRVSGDQVRIGIEAPPEVLVLRDELEPRVVNERRVGTDQSWRFGAGDDLHAGEQATRRAGRRRRTAARR